MTTRSISPSLLDKYDIDGQCYSSYPTVSNWNNNVTADDYCDTLSTLSGDLALYMHLPFCALRCVYCGCSAAVTTRLDVVTAYLTRLESELEMVRSVMGGSPVIRELHWGGGTPNFLADGQLVRAFDLVASRFTLGSDVECSVEADPRLVTTTQLRWMRGLGFNRISFGVQDLDPIVQNAIGRVQSIALITDVVEHAREQGFSSLNLDVLYGLPYQSLESFGDTIDAVIELSPERIACLGYEHAPRAHSQQQRLDAWALPDRTLRRALHGLAVERFTEAGYVWIGAEHFAKPHDSLAIAAAAGQLHRDYMGYTTRPSRTFIGAGVSAVGEVGDLLVQNEAHLGDWQRAIDESRLPLTRGHRLSCEDRARRNAIRGLLCNLTVQRNALPSDGAQTLDAFREFEADGLVLIGEHAITVTPTGRYFLQTIASACDAYSRQPSAVPSPRCAHTA